MNGELGIRAMVIRQQFSFSRQLHLSTVAVLTRDQ